MTEESVQSEANSEIQATAPRLQPVAERQRLDSMDVLRGVAVLGILAMNVVAFGLPLSSYMNPTLIGGFEGPDRAVWILNHLVFDQKFMTIFSMLFGAGLVLMWDRAEAKGKSLFGVFYRRNLWLLLIGLIHAYLIWWGDILFYYAIGGFFIYFFRKKPAKTLSVVGGVMLIVPLAFSYLFATAIQFGREDAQEIEARLAAGEEISEEDRRILDDWEKTEEELFPSQEQVQQEVDAHRGSYLELLRFRAPRVRDMHLTFTLTFIFWRAGGLMLIGMAFMKWGIFAASRSNAFYLKMVLIGYGLGLPLNVLSTVTLIDVSFDFETVMRYAGDYNYFSSLLMAAGHIGLIMLVCRNSVWEGLRSRLAAVGRMAFTNYLMHSVICTFLFYGYGLAWFGQLHRRSLVLIVLAVWILQLILSPIWLRRFQFGPAEWLWRTLTYGRLQPMARAA